MIKCIFASAHELRDSQIRMTLEIIFSLVLLIEAALFQYAWLYALSPEKHPLHSWFVRTDGAPRDPKKRKQLGGFLVTVLLAFLFGVSGLSVLWKWIVWFGCFCAFLVVIQSAVDSLYELPTKTKLVGGILLALGFAATVWLPARAMWREEQAGLLEGDLVGAGGQHFSNLTTPWVQIGDSKTILIMLPQEIVQPYFKPFPDAEFFVEGGNKGPLISTTVRDRHGNVVVDIKQSHWTVHPPYCSDKNYTKDSLEVKDSSGHVLLQIRLGFPKIQVQGEWWSNEGKGLRILETKDGTHGEVIPLVPQNQHNDDLIKEIFKYPSKDHWGEFEN